MEKKYEILYNDSKEFEGNKMYRIRALRDINNLISKGELGGYITIDENSELSQENECWVYNGAFAIHSIISGDSQIYPDCIVTDSIIIDRCYIANGSRITSSRLSSSIIINGSIIEKSRIYGAPHARIHASVIANANLTCLENTLIGPNAVISKNNDVCILPKGRYPLIFCKFYDKDGRKFIGLSGYDLPEPIISIQDFIRDINRPWVRKHIKNVKQCISFAITYMK